MKIDREINLKYLDLHMKVSFELTGFSSFNIILHSVNLTEIETTLLQFYKEEYFKITRLFLLVMIIDPQRPSHFLIKKKTEIPIPGGSDVELQSFETLALDLELVDDGTGKVEIKIGF